jgi:hypothetical protein
MDGVESLPGDFLECADGDREQIWSHAGASM